MSKHTPGPWMIGNIQGVDMVIENHNGLEVCTVWEDPKQHDARLIAAAPDLLEALQYVMVAHGEQLDHAFQMAQDAINKATGSAA
jgi:hypothetical protein